MSLEVQLITPAKDFADTYREFVADFQAHQEPLVPWVLEWHADPFSDLLGRYADTLQETNLELGFVPHSTFWLIDSEQRLLGVSNLRHRLNERLQRVGGHIGFGIRPSERNRGFATRLLALTLERAKCLSIDRALLTCDEMNLASARVIEKNGGVLDAPYTDENGRVTRRYWIEIP